MSVGGRSPAVLADRFGAVTAHATVTLAALLAADLAGPDGFRPTDVRFFFLLFTNWMEDDHLRPGLDLDLTQARRALARLVADGHAEVLGTGRAPPYRLTAVGVLALVEGVTDPRVPRTFEEVVFLANAAASYRDALAERLRGLPRAPDRIVRTLLDPVRILRAERHRLEGAVTDLEERIAASLEMEAVAKANPGLSPDALAERLRAEVGSYQLHPMRSLRELVAGLPPGLARQELGPGIGLRARTLFTPLLEQLRARVAILSKLEEGWVAAGR